MTAPRGTRRTRRAVRHVAVAAGSLVAGAAVWLMLQHDDWVTSLSMSTAYVAAGLLAVTLALGPLRVLRNRPNPPSTDLRRDVGIWAGIIALIHTAVGLQVHLRGSMWQYFVWPPGEWLGGVVPLRVDLFGIANWTGLLSVAVLVLLLALSNDRSLRRLGGRRWKALQRWNYAAAGLVVVHGVVYQVIERRQLRWVVTLGTVVGGALILQAAGFLSRRRAALPRDESAPRPD